MKRYLVDWKLAGGFSALLFLMVAIGCIGIFQIQFLSKKLNDLGRYYLPVTQSALRMRVKNSLYATSIRSYIFWHSAKYLEAARNVASRKKIGTMQLGLERQLTSYLAFVRTAEERKQVQLVRRLEKTLFNIGEKIIDSVDHLREAGSPAAKNKIKYSINRLMMVFENQLYKIDKFIEGSIVKANFKAVRKQLFLTEVARERATRLLIWALILGLLIGSDTAWLVYQNRRRYRQWHQQLTRRMITLEEEERKKLSRQVHDQMGQDLSALMIYSDLINKKISGSNQDIQEYILQSRNILSDLIIKSHNIAELLRPPVLEEVGLVGAIKGLIFRYEHITSIKFNVSMPAAILNLTSEYSFILYRVVQEALTNIAKYSQAKKASISLEKKANAVYLTISDDGVGFNYRQYLRQPRRHSEERPKIGRASGRERVEISVVAVS